MSSRRAIASVFAPRCSPALSSSRLDTAIAYRQSSIMAEAARPVNSVQVFGRKVLHDESWFEPDTWSNERDARYDSIPLWRR